MRDLTVDIGRKRDRFGAQYERSLILLNSSILKSIFY